MTYQTTIADIQTYEVRGVAERKITKDVATMFNMKVEYNEQGDIVAHYYPYTNTQGEVCAYKKRTLPKEFSVVGDIKQATLFNQSNCKGDRYLIITEGELDAMAVKQAFLTSRGQSVDVVSLTSATGMKNLLAQRDWVRRYQNVTLMFDQDEAGQKAMAEAARIVGIDKVKICSFTGAKDACDVLINQGADALVGVYYQHKPWTPSGVISSSDTWELYQEEQQASYTPWPDFAKRLNAMSYGRRFGSITMITSGTGMGKSSFLKEDQYHLLKTTTDKVGVCSLEESIYEAVGSIMALEANKRIHLPDVEVSPEEERELWEKTMKDGRFMFLDHQGSVSDSSLIDKIEFMALSGCKYIYLDHITIAVSDSGDNVNAAIDRMMSDLLKLCKRYNIWIGVVSHLRKVGSGDKSFEQGAVPSDDDLKGSGSLKQIAAQIIAIARNKTEEDRVKRHTSALWVLKDRSTGRTGPAGKYLFDEQTGRLSELISFDE